jgi:hypothetical protein
MTHQYRVQYLLILQIFFGNIFLGGLEYVGHFFASVAHVVFLSDGWIRTQTAAIATRALPT